MKHGCLDAAGIFEPHLRQAYADCRRLHARHGRTYYLATLLLPPGARPYVHALYGFARYVDDLVDLPAPGLTPERRAARLATFGQAFLAAARDGSDPGHPISRAAAHTVRRWGIPLDYLEAFLASMRMDLSVTGYATYEELMGYVHGSAAVIGLELLPILGTCGPGAEPYARDLGVAFQLVNFIRDVGEDLRRGRVYLPAADLAAFEVEVADLAGGVVDGRIRRLLAFEIARTRELLRSGAAGVRLLHPQSRDCVRAALTLYAEILDAVEAADYQVLDRRVRVHPARRVQVALPAAVAARRARRRVGGSGAGGEPGWPR